MARTVDLSSSGPDNGKAVADALSPLLYAELKTLAARAMRRERKGHTLQTTALVHEAWMRVAGQRNLDLANRDQVLAIAARMMRRVLVDHARRRQAVKRNGEEGVRELPEFELGAEAPGVASGDIIALDGALSRLETLSPRQAQVVDLKFFAGLELEEISAALGIARPTVVRDWRMARAWLERELSRV
jgi:RNA polymerase sigma factor (TIGR02999 family)